MRKGLRAVDAGLAAVLRRKVVAYVALVLPGVLMWWPAVVQDPSFLAGPAQYFLDVTGVTATVLLVTVLCFTPLRRIAPWSRLVGALNRHRREVGVASFLYAAAHLFFFCANEGGLAGLPRNLDKPFILFGLGAWVALALLALTSSNRMVRWLGGRRWKQLHRLAYGAAVLVFFHYAMQEKAGAYLVFVVFAPLVVLQLLRLGLWARHRGVVEASG